MKPFILAFDIGTSSCKATVFTEKLEVLAYGKGGYGVQILENGWVEQDPSEILKGVRAAVKELEQKLPALKEVQAISISSQASAQCLVGCDDRPLTNILSWMDKRAASEAEEFVAAFPKHEIIKLTGMDMMVTPAYSLAKLKWLKRHCSKAVASAKYFVQLKEIVIRELTGEWVSDSTSLKGIVNQETGDPIPEIMEFIGVSGKIIPRVKQPFEIAGNLKANVEGMEALAVGIPVVVGWNDMNAAFLGMTGFPTGCVGVDMTGTSEHFGVVSMEDVSGERYEGLNKVPFLNHSNLYYGVTSSGGQAAEWFAKDIMQYVSVGECFEQLAPYERFPLDEVEELIFVPYIEGERNPWNDTLIRGSWVGLGRMHKQKHMAWSVLEGVCFALKAMYERFPVKPGKIVVSGGASKSDVWTQMKADVIGVPFERMSQTEAGCTGAAVLAMRALHPDWSMETLNRLLPASERVFKPNAELYSYYDKKYRRFIALYHELKKNYYEEIHR